jgi:hypothetical protein
MPAITITGPGTPVPAPAAPPTGRAKNDSSLTVLISLIANKIFFLTRMVRFAYAP